jgi:two-component system LytT family response regulator
MRVLVVDDEPLACLGVTARLQKHLDMEVVAECGDAQEALEAIADLKPDLVFLDIQMPGLSGLELLKTVPRDTRPSVVFLTAHEEYAVSAFEVEALDYLLKPVDDERFDACLGRARRLLTLKRQESLYEQLQGLVSAATGVPDRQYIRQFAVRRGSAVTFVKTADVDWIEGLGDYAGLHVQDKTRLIREPLSSLAERLDPTEFQRIHRSCIVQVNRIVRVESLSNRDLLVTLCDSTILRVSRTYSASLSGLFRNVTS